MLVECIFFFEAVSQPATANTPAIPAKRQLCLWNYSKPFRPLSQLGAFLTDFPMDQKMCSQDFTVMAGNVLGVK